MSRLDLSLINKMATVMINAIVGLMLLSVVVLSATTDNTANVFINCPPPTTFNVSSTFTRIWWTKPSVVPYKVVLVWKTAGFSPGAYFPEGRHSVMYKARNIDGSLSTCQLVFTVHVIRCEAINLPNPLLASCSKGNQMNSQCSLQCISGYRLMGSSNIHCEQNGEWSDTFPTCKSMSCSTLLGPPNGYAICTTPLNQHGSRCYFGCHSGYILAGHTARVCRSRQWSGKPPTCVDAHAPYFLHCPRSHRLENEAGTMSATVTYMTPTATDAAGSNVTVTLVQGNHSGSRFMLGSNFIKYNAEDEAGNIAECRFYIHVIDIKSPTFTYCPEVIYANAVDGARSVIVNYTTPIARDNSAPSDINVTRLDGNASGTMFAAGLNLIRYRARDSSMNSAECRFYIIVRVITCRRLGRPRNGYMNCSQSTSDTARWCEFGCNTNYELVGSFRRICTRDTWTGSVAICIRNELLVIDTGLDEDTATSLQHIIADTNILTTDITASDDAIPDTRLVQREMSSLTDDVAPLVRTTLYENSGIDEEESTILQQITAYTETLITSVTGGDGVRGTRPFSHIRPSVMDNYEGTTPPKFTELGEWAVWEPCMVTCGGALQRRVRICHEPVETCDGREERRQCSLQDCPSELDVGQEIEY